MTWTDWGYQTDYEDEVHDVDDIPSLRDHVFDRRDYDRVITAAIARMGQQR